MAELNLKQWFRGNMTPYLKEIKAQIQSQVGAVTGTYRGSQSTYTALPTGSPVKTGDWAVLTADDGGNESGIYVKSSSGWDFVADIASFNEIVSELVASQAEYDAGSTSKVPTAGQVKTTTDALDSRVTANESDISTLHSTIGSVADASAADGDGYDDAIQQLDASKIQGNTDGSLVSGGFLNFVVSNIIQKLSGFALLGGSDSQKFLVANADEQTQEAVSANQFDFSISDAEAQSDYNNA